MVTLKKKLERLAIEAHTRGEVWNDFWSDHGDAIREAEPFDRQRYRRLLMKLTALVAGGDLDGCMPISTGDSAPWELDDAVSE